MKLSIFLFGLEQPLRCHAKTSAHFLSAPLGHLPPVQIHLRASSPYVIFYVKLYGGKNKSRGWRNHRFFTQDRSGSGLDGGELWFVCILVTQLIETLTIHSIANDPEMKYFWQSCQSGGTHCWRLSSACNKAS